MSRRAPLYTLADLPAGAADKLSPADRKALGLDVTSASLDTPGRAKWEAKKEKTLQQACEGLLRRRDVEFNHMSHRAREKKGEPDFTFSLNGRHFAIELKTEEGRLSDDQKRVLSGYLRNGSAVHVCRTYDQFLAVLSTSGEVSETKWINEGKMT